MTGMTGRRPGPCPRAGLDADVPERHPRGLPKGLAGPQRPRGAGGIQDWAGRGVRDVQAEKGDGIGVT